MKKELRSIEYNPERFYKPKKPKRYWNKLGRRTIKKELQDIVRFKEVVLSA